MQDLGQLSGERDRKGSHRPSGAQDTFFPPSFLSLQSCDMAEISVVNPNKCVERHRFMSVGESEARAAAGQHSV